MLRTWLPFCGCFVPNFFLEAPQSFANHLEVPLFYNAHYCICFFVPVIISAKYASMNQMWWPWPPSLSGLCRTGTQQLFLLKGAFLMYVQAHNFYKQEQEFGCKYNSGAIYTLLAVLLAPSQLIGIHW